MAKPGTRNLLTDIDGILVGNAENTDIQTGVTVIKPTEPAICAVHVAGGGPGTRETDALKLGTLVDKVDAVVLSGGSVYGLAAADGVIAEMGASGDGFALMDMPGVPKSPVVPSAILYDLANGGNKGWGSRPPYNELGRAALTHCSETFELGRTGAGYGARAGALQGGLGSASIETHDGLQVAAITAVNAFGSVKVPNSDAYWAAPYEIGDEFGGIPFPSETDFSPDDWGPAKANPAPRQNTTIALVATNVTLTPSQAQRMASMAVAGLARAIRPVFAPFDGDVVFAISTAKKDLPVPQEFNLARLGELAAGCLARAVARGVHEAQPS